MQTLLSLPPLELYAETPTHLILALSVKDTNGKDMQQFFRLSTTPARQAQCGEIRTEYDGLEILTIDGRWHPIVETPSASLAAATEPSSIMVATTDGLEV